MNHASVPNLDLLTCEEAAAYLRVHPRTVYRLLRDGGMPGVRVGRQWRIRRSDLDAYLGRETQTPRNVVAAPAS